MASILLSAAGSALGTATGLPSGTLLGGRLGRLVGGFIDDSIFGGIKLKDREGPRLTDLAVQSSAYGRMIPIVYGSVRIAGNIIWSRPIRETVTTTTSSSSAGGGKGGGGRVTQTTTTYSYSVSMAISICEGEITEVLRVWADAKQLDLSQYTMRIYKGDETQTPDSFIQSFEGATSTPAYRGQAYVVIEDFPLADFGNRIPNFTFEVKKKAQHEDYNDQIVENLITAVTLIPGAGEFVYDTQVQVKISGEQAGGSFAQQGGQQSINMHNATGTANVLLSLDQLAETLPNVSWVSVVVTWFGDDMDAANCVVKPGVEYQSGGTTSPEVWTSAGFTRSTARQITLEDGSPRYGGTPDDQSIIRLLTELKARGYNVMFYPIMFMDVAGKSWRGDLTGSASAVSSFFTKTNGFNAFITHYATLTKDYCDAFVIGSELKGLTKVADTPGNYPAVNELVSLAATVKGIVGSGVKVTYAADWSEYHHTDGGWYHMDPLWASANIDFIGIDAYFPLTDAPQSGYDIDTLIAGWTSGEGYDWYYTDANRTMQASLSAPYAWKDIQWFWENTHTNPDMSTTAWVAEGKPIWFTEYGFPSVDGAANQPNVFYDPTTAGSAFPYHSKGRVDFRAQRAALTATEIQWAGSTMIENKFVWTWDARPYPYWPDLTNVWADGPVWKTGHWVQGKLGISSLAAIVKDLLLRAGLAEADFDVQDISDQVEGFVITGQQSIRSSIEQLQLGYFFDAVESGNALKFIPRGSASALTIPENDLVPEEEGENSRSLISITRQQEIELPQRVNVVYLNRLSNYQPATQYAERQVTESREKVTRNLPIVFSDQRARVIADVALFAGWTGRTSYSLSLPAKYAALEPADVFTVTVDGVSHTMRATSIRFSSPGRMQVDAIAEDAAAYDFYTPPGDSIMATEEASPLAETDLELLDLPLLPGDAPDTAIMRAAGAGLGSNWNGAVLYRSDDGGTNYDRLLDIPASAVMGTALDALADGPTEVFDETGSVTVLLLGEGELYSATELAVLNGANACALGNEIIQFRTATLLAPGKYQLTGLLRGRLGTEHATATHAAGERFVLLNALVAKEPMPAALIGLARDYKPVSVGSTLDATTNESFTYSGKALKPYAPVHITGTRDGSGNLTIDWIRRTRSGGDWKDSVDIPLNEVSEAYEVEILNGSTVVRTLTGLSTPQASYSATDQTTDFGSAQGSLDVRIYQLSATLGRGYPGENTV